MDLQACVGRTGNRMEEKRTLGFFQEQLIPDSRRFWESERILGTCEK